MSLRYVIALNGPPRCGKDSIGNALKLRLEGNYRSRVAKVQLSLPMRHAVFGLIGRVYDEELYESLKDTVMLDSGQTLRQMMIDLSERHIKPLYGHDYWVRAAMASQVPESAEVAIITDLGFSVEASWLESKFGRNFMIAQVTRDGTDWGKDSRAYHSALTTLMVPNNSTVAMAASQIRNTCKHLGWDFSPSGRA